MSKTFEVIVPMYGYVTLEIEAGSKEEASELAYEDCMNIAVDMSEMDNCDDNFMVSPYEFIHKGNMSNILYSEVVVSEVEEY